MKRRKMTEQELAAHVVQWLGDRKIYQEVQHPVTRDGSSCVADIVVDTGDGYGWVIECKVSFGLAVLAQAREWIRKGARQVSVAVCQPKSNRWALKNEHLLGIHVAEWLGIGVIFVNRFGEVHERTTAPIHDKSGLQDILTSCRTEHTNHAAAGSANGGHWTPFRQTCENLVTYVLEHPRCSLKDAILAIEYHYASASTAVSSLRKWINAGRVKGLKFEREGRKDLLVLTERKDGP